MEWMLARVLGLSRLEVYLAHDRPVSESEKEDLRAMVARRGKGEPLAYILGDQEFCGLEFKVTRDVLIPRPETEHLVSCLREQAPQSSRGVDLGTGSGAIAVALCHARPDLTMIATDASGAALEVARDNAERLGVADRVEFREGSWWAPLADEPPLDFAVSNPPYVDPERSELLADDVREFEPESALMTPAGEPAAAYAAIVAGIEGRLKPGALLFFETGVGADDAALAVLERSDLLTEVALSDDEAGLPRYLFARVRS
jgi:release factor glutamine methyltransferase